MLSYLKYIFSDVLIGDLWFSNVDSAPQGFSALSMCYQHLSEFCIYGMPVYILLLIIVHQWSSEYS